MKTVFGGKSLFAFVRYLLVYLKKHFTHLIKWYNYWVKNPL